MTIRTSLVGVAVALAVPAAAAAKEVERAAVCGADGCERIEVGGDARTLMGGGSVTDPPAQPAAFYRLRFAIGDGTGEVFGRVRLVYVPSGGKIQFDDGTWMRLVPATEKAMQRAVAGLEPFPARALRITRAPANRVQGGAPAPAGGPDAVTSPASTAATAPDPASGPVATDQGGVPAWLVALAAAAGVAALAVLRRRSGRASGAAAT